MLENSLNLALQIKVHKYASDISDIMEFYNLRGRKERIFDEMTSGFGWKRLPKSFMSENTAYLLKTVLIRNFYKTFIQKINAKDFGLSVTSCIKALVFKYISLAAKWIKTSRTYRLNIYTEIFTYARAFNAQFLIFSWRYSILPQVASCG